jgi:prepilin-type N-terminal cleavage/methylation domain-containing protein
MENHIEAEEVKQDKGFTLVELLIVIVILGILATVTVFAVTGITNKGKTSACNSDKKTLETAEEAYQANTGNDYTANQADLVAAGFMHEATPNFTITVTGTGAASRYHLVGVNNSAGGGADCSFIV